VTAIVVGVVAGVNVGVTSDGKVWALGRSWKVEEANELIVHLTKATGLARLQEQGESSTDMGSSSRQGDI
jgi:hypothetical protein